MTVRMNWSPGVSPLPSPAVLTTRAPSAASRATFHHGADDDVASDSVAFGHDEDPGVLLAQAGDRRAQGRTLLDRGHAAP
jgi:hypothetical protein